MYHPEISINQSGGFTHIVPTLSTGRYIALATLTILFWLFTHPYYGIWHDAILYTAQALNILYPEIYQGDVFFKYGSQASFTIFPRLHALLIQLIGVDNSALILTITGQALFFTGFLSLARQFLTKGQTALFLIIFTTLPIYHNPVLYIFEVFATSRTFSTGLALLSLTFYLKNRIIVSGVMLIIALLLHPLMPLGVIAIALFLQRPKVILSLLTLGMILLVIGYAFAIPPATLLNLTIDNEWRDLVTKRAPFLFIELWLDEDLSLFLLEICIILSARAYCTDKLRQILNAVLIATAVCISVSLIASFFSNALLIQLQLWRILLIVHIVTSIAFAWLISAAWNRDSGKVVILLYCSIFLSFDAIGGLPSLAVYIFWLYSLKHHLKLPPIAVKGAYVILAQCVFWYILKTSFTDPTVTTKNLTFELVSNIKYFLVSSPFYITVFLVAILIYSKNLQKAFLTYLSLAILFLAPIATFYFDQRQRNATWDNGDYEPYISLRKEIPESANIYCEHGVSACWFELRRRHYMSPSQSAGVVFSRKTANETKRRADLLLNAGFDDGVYARHWQDSDPEKPPEPTLEAFEKLCQDPVLDYIITKPTSIPKKPDKTIDTAKARLNLYDCSQVDYQASTPEPLHSSTDG